MRFGLIILSLVVALSQAVQARNISWFSDPGSINQDSGGALMDGAFRFELGVFDSDFVPTSGNVSEWAGHWHSCQRQNYNSQTKRIDGFFTVSGDSGPFVAGAAAYVWGFRGAGVTGEWILFRAPHWTWPAADPFNPFPLEWNAAQATAILGTIDADGAPFLMRSAPVGNAVPPETGWDQWHQDELTGEPLNQASDDPDRDGIPNLLEFVFGTPPRSPNAAVPTTIHLVAGHPTITIPRRADHAAILNVEVSDDLIHWYSGPGFTEVVMDSVSSLVVRHVAAQAPGTPKRFMRVRAETP